MTAKLVNIIFGMKIRQARMETGLSLTDFASACDLSASYVTEIEKGRKYPRSDKIMRMAEVLGKSYDELVSIKLDASLAYLESTLSSSILRRFPFEEFGLEMGDLMQLLTREPEKVSALLHAILEIVRRYDLQDEEFLRGALRSYQEIHENYFPEIEDAAVSFTQQYGDKYDIHADSPVSLEALQQLLEEEYGYEIDSTTIAENEPLSGYRSIFVPGERPKFYFNNQLYSRQIKFLLARELGYQFLKIKERSTISHPEEIVSFHQLLNDYRAAYFGGALLMPRQAVLADLQTFFSQTTWQPQMLAGMLSKYDVTPEMLFYRFSELIPQHFDIQIHFLRFHQANGSYKLVKHLNMNQLSVPSGIGLNEHYCRRWLSVRLLREMKAAQLSGDWERFPLPGIHISRFVDSNDRFVAIGFARSLVLSPDVNSSVTVGFRIMPNLSKTVRFLDDPTIPHVVINETCERCPLTAVECDVRAAEPVVLVAEKQKAARKAALAAVMGES
ncbi:MAG: hypothetical protein Kow0080_12720 [Candidatus Promineifilaceae bacterium]